MRKSAGMMAIGPKPVHVKRALGKGYGRKGMTGTHSVKHPGGFGYGRGGKKR